MARRKRVINTIVVRKQVRSNPGRPRRRNRPRRQRNNRQVMSRQETRKLVQSLADPWSVSACIPDGANGTGCFSIKETHILGTGVGGSCTGISFNPQGIKNFTKDDNAGTPSTAATPTITGSYVVASQATTIDTLYSAARLVSAGIKVRYVGNTQTDQGILIVGQVSEQVAPSSFNGLSLQAMQALMQNYKIFPLRSGGTITWRPQSMDDTIQFGSTAGTAVAISTAPTVPWLIAYVYGANAATASLITCDLIANYEGQYKSQTFLPGGIDAVAHPAEPGWYESALNAVRKLDPIMPYVASTLTNVFNSPVANSAMGMLLGTQSRRGMPRLDYMSVD